MDHHQYTSPIPQDSHPSTTDNYCTQMPYRTLPAQEPQVSIATDFDIETPYQRLPILSSRPSALRLGYNTSPASNFPESTTVLGYVPPSGNPAPHHAVSIPPLPELGAIDTTVGRYSSLARMPFSTRQSSRADRHPLTLNHLSPHEFTPAHDSTTKTSYPGQPIVNVEPYQGTSQPTVWYNPQEDFSFEKLPRCLLPRKEQRHQKRSKTNNGSSFATY